MIETKSGCHMISPFLDYMTYGSYGQTGFIYQYFFCSI